MTVTGAVNYGLRKEGGGVWQNPGRAHDRNWRGYSQCNTLVKRQMPGGGDLLEEFQRGRFGGPLPGWLVKELGG
jgi:hypothetical protein